MAHFPLYWATMLLTILDGSYYHKQKMTLPSVIEDSIETEQSWFQLNKKVLLRDRKRHTTRRVIGTPVSGLETQRMQSSSIQRKCRDTPLSCPGWDSTGPWLRDIHQAGTEVVLVIGPETRPSYPRPPDRIRPRTRGILLWTYRQTKSITFLTFLFSTTKTDFNFSWYLFFYLYIRSCK